MFQFYFHHFYSACAALINHPSFIALLPHPNYIALIHHSFCVALIRHPSYVTLIPHLIPLQIDFFQFSNVSYPSQFT